MYIAFFVLDETNLKSKYSQTCNKTKKKWPYRTGELLKEVQSV